MHKPWYALLLVMQTHEVSIGNQNEINIQLIAGRRDVIMKLWSLDMRSQTKRNITGSIAVVDDDSYSDRAAGVTSYAPRVKKTIVATPVVRQTDVEFTLEELFSVKSDGEMRTTDMVEYELDALYEYYCVPKLDADAFLIAKISTLG